MIAKSDDVISTVSHPFVNGYDKSMFFYEKELPNERLAVRVILDKAYIYIYILYTYPLNLRCNCSYIDVKEICLGDRIKTF